MMEVLLSLFSRVRSAPEEGGAASNMNLSEEEDNSLGDGGGGVCVGVCVCVYICVYMCVCVCVYIVFCVSVLETRGNAELAQAVESPHLSGDAEDFLR